MSISAMHQNLTPQIQQAIAQASQKVGVDFDYMVQKAGVESNFRTDIRAKTSSATGLYQFLDQTWLGMVKQTGQKHSLKDYSAAIEKSASGRFHVSDPVLRQEILDLRKDPKTAALMAAEFAMQNQQHLESRGLNNVGGDELYLAHFLGAGGASRFLKAAQQNPAGIAAEQFPAAAKANERVFYNADGAARSYREVLSFFEERLDTYALGPRANDTASAVPATPQPYSAYNTYASPSAPRRFDPIASHHIDPMTMVMLMELKTPDELS